MMELALTPLAQLDQSAHNFAVNSWVRARAQEEPRSLSCAQFHKSFPPLARFLAARGDVSVAHFIGEPRLYIGWIAHNAENGLLHYMYVKNAYRRHGAGSRMLAMALDGAPATLTLAPHVAWVRQQAVALGYRYDPYQLAMIGRD